VTALQNNSSVHSAQQSVNNKSTILHAVAYR